MTLLGDFQPKHTSSNNTSVRLSLHFINGVIWDIPNCRNLYEDKTSVIDICTTWRRQKLQETI